MDSLCKELKLQFPHLSFTKKSLESPSKMFVCEFYSLFLDKYFEYMGDLKKGEFVLLTNDQLNYLKAHHSPEIIIYHSMKTLFNSFDVGNKFLLDDLLNPTRERTTKNIHLCLHFLQFSNDFLCTKYHFDETFEVMEKFNELKQMKEEAVERYNNQTTEITRKINYLESLNRRNEATKKEFQKFSMQAESRKSRIQSGITKVNTLKANVDCAYLKLEKHKTGCAKLKDALVDNDEMQTLENILTIHKENIEELIKELETKSQRLNEVESQISHLKICLTELQTLKLHEPKEADDFEKNSKLLANLKHELAKAQKELCDKMSENEKRKIELRTYIQIEKDLKNQEDFKQKDYKEKSTIICLKHKESIAKGEIFMDKVRRKIEEIQNGIEQIAREENKLKKNFKSKYPSTLEDENKLMQLLNNQIIKSAEE